MTSGGNNFNDFPENQLQKNYSPNFFQEASGFQLSMQWTFLGDVMIITTIIINDCRRLPID